MAVVQTKFLASGLFHRPIEWKLCINSISSICSGMFVQSTNYFKGRFSSYNLFIFDDLYLIRDFFLVVDKIHTLEMALILGSARKQLTIFLWLSLCNGIKFNCIKFSRGAFGMSKANGNYFAVGYWAFNANLIVTCSLLIFFAKIPFVDDELGKEAVPIATKG